jgi:lipoate-protein ligase A
LDALLAAPWRLIIDPATSGEWNMAADNYLLEHAEVPTLRLYRWDQAYLSLGYAQASGWLDANRVARVRRPSGGRAVLHADEITYAIALPVAPYPRVADNYAALLRLWETTLQRLGWQVEKSKGTAPSRANPSCYQLQQRGELCLQGRKLMGSAQVCRGQRLLQHGCLPLGVDSDLFSALFPGSDPPASLPGLTEAQLVKEFPAALQRLDWSAMERAEIGRAAQDYTWPT